MRDYWVGICDKCGQDIYVGICDKCGQDVYAHEDESEEWCYYCEEEPNLEVAE